jgi:hypothetical protein
MSLQQPASPVFSRAHIRARQESNCHLGRDRPRGYTSGVNSFNRFLQFVDNRCELRPNSTTTEICATLVEYIDYVLENEHNINSFQTLSNYITHIKDDFKRRCANDQSPASYVPRWPATKKMSGYDCFPLQAAVDSAKVFYNEFESTGRTALTPGVLLGYAKFLNLNDPIDRLFWTCAWLTCSAGTRAGELLSTKFTAKHVTINTDVITLRVYNGKAREWQHAVAYASEFAPVADYFGSAFDLHQLMRSVLHSRQAPDDAPFFTHGSYTLTYDKFNDRMKVLNDLLGISPGKLGPHSGRIYRATLMFHQGIPKDVIMARGRWRGVSWKRYARMVLQQHNPQARWIRIGQISTDLRNCPSTPEFARGTHYHL